MTLFKFTVIVKKQSKNLVDMTGLLLVMQARPKSSARKICRDSMGFFVGRHYYENHQSY